MRRIAFHADAAATLSASPVSPAPGGHGGSEVVSSGYCGRMATAAATTTGVPLPPGPSAGRLAQAAAFHRDPLGFLRRTRGEFGDAFTLRLAVAGPMVVFTDPAV